ncbi:MAG TPA: PQQ-binding-like beta-propeller repeat protein, partial [Pyrinomonadaceae bacterium]|nr:PQQ-binding-like beta-propeller repeat protein [Pyrinomonadaceae bacterium]
MHSPPSTNLALPVILCLLAGSSLVLAFTSCGGTLVTETVAEPVVARPAPPPPSLPMWLGNTSRTFYGTGPWADRPLEVKWSFETRLTSGRLHKDGWGGSSWPGQPTVRGNRVYFGSADSYLYCLDRETGSLVWSFKTNDSLKASPT